MSCACYARMMIPVSWRCHLARRRPVRHRAADLLVIAQQVAG
jgi:hypothetical protein